MQNIEWHTSNGKDDALLSKTSSTLDYFKGSDTIRPSFIEMHMGAGSRKAHRITGKWIRAGAIIPPYKPVPWGGMKATGAPPWE